MNKAIHELRDSQGGQAIELAVVKTKLAVIAWLAGTIGGAIASVIVSVVVLSLKK